jgi:hypothetical protein
MTGRNRRPFASEGWGFESLRARFTHAESSATVPGSSRVDRDHKIHRGTLLVKDPASRIKRLIALIGK